MTFALWSDDGAYWDVELIPGRCRSDGRAVMATAPSRSSSVPALRGLRFGPGGIVRFATERRSRACSVLGTTCRPCTCGMDKTA